MQKLTLHPLKRRAHYSPHSGSTAPGLGARLTDSGSQQHGSACLFSMSLAAQRGLRVGI